MGPAYKWVELRARIDGTTYEDYRDEGMCCSSIYQTRTLVTCSICDKAPHPMVERRLQCTSPTCYSSNPICATANPSQGSDDAPQCPVTWKVYYCKSTESYRVLQSPFAHLRGHGPCGVIKPHKLTEAMKQFVARQDECGFPPRVIVVNMQKDPANPVPRRGWPTPMQVTNALKTLRRRQGAKNSLKAVRAFVKANCYSADIASNQAFLFGYTTIDEGYPYVGCGDDDDPFIVGVTSLALLQNCAKYASPDRSTMFHADATFKLSDLGYPVITCGFTDRARSYQVAAIFVVSRRTAREYSECFRSLSRLFRTLLGVTVSVNYVMGDAEDAQTNAYVDIGEFKNAHVLMCFFHVLYNVRKRTHHLSVYLRKIVMKAIMDMHFAVDLDDFDATRLDAIKLWKSKRHLVSFAAYFEKEWLRGKYRHWQAYHTPTGFATTNNPCEIFNASMKRFFQRRRWHMQVLLQKLMDLVGITFTKPPVSSDYIAMPSSDIKQTAKLMLDAKRVSVTETSEPMSCRVVHVQDIESCETNEEDDPESYDSEFVEAFDTLNVVNDGPCDGVVEPSDVSDALHAQGSWAADLAAEREKEKAAKLYDGAVKWSIKRSHERGMPSSGWLVDMKNSSCRCSYYTKFTICAHILVARSWNGIGNLGEKKLTSRIMGRTAKARAKAIRKKSKKSSKVSGRKANSQTNTTGAASKPDVPKCQPRGRLPLASSALMIDYILDN
jgi:hypothetical protein